jgi:tRNA 2-thiouridine synthesizing protein A
MVKFDCLVDARGESCPMPLLRAKLKLNEMKDGECVKVMATDAGSVRDFEAFISLTPHELKAEHSENEFIYFITKH